MNASMTMLAVNFAKKNFRRDGGGCFIARFKVAEPIQILNSKRPDLPVHLQMGQVGFYMKNVGFRQGYLQGKGQEDGQYIYSLII